MRQMLLLCSLFILGCGKKPADRVVLYSAQDPPFAEAVLEDFTRQTGIPVASKFDTEANKSVGLFRELQLEAGRPRCDVHWNNEIITTLILARDGILDAYDSPSAKAYPAFARSADHTWNAFAGRARVLIVNTTLVSAAERPARLLELVEPKWKGKLAMAKPMHGTTATQAVCLFEVLGKDDASAFYQGLKANEVKIYAGNKNVAEAVGRGDAAIGLTDTDDAIEEVNAGNPVAIIFPDSGGGTDRHPRLGTLFIPNTVAVIKGCPNPAGAKKLVDYLLSPEVEAKLATAGGFQIPLNPAVKADLPPALQPARAAKPMTVDFAKAAALWEDVQTFLRNEFAR